MSAAEQLNDYLAGDLPDTVHDHFVVDDPGRAEWALRKLGAVRKQMDENEAVATEEKRLIQLWLTDTNATLERSAAFFEALLTAWHERVLADDGDRKTISLPCGDLKARKQPDRWDFSDEFTAWATAHRPELIRTKVELDRAAAKKALEAVSVDCVVDADSGEKVPGVTVEPGSVKFTVDVRK